MIELEELIASSGGQRFKGSDFRDLLRPGVYVIMLKGRPLYVGMGNRLLRRLASPHHKQYVIDECDEILLYPCRSLEAAQKLEIELIGRFRPIHNERSEGKRVSDLLGISRRPIYLAKP